MKFWLKLFIAMSLLLSGQSFAGWDANEERDARKSIAEFKKT